MTRKRPVFYRADSVPPLQTATGARTPWGLQATRVRYTGAKRVSTARERHRVEEFRGTLLLPVRDSILVCARRAWAFWNMPPGKSFSFRLEAQCVSAGRTYKQSTWAERRFLDFAWLCPSSANVPGFGFRIVLSDYPRGISSSYRVIGDALRHYRVGRDNTITAYGQIPFGA